jgi:hypothetical protein
LQDKSRGRQLFSGRRGEEIGSPSQPFHGSLTSGTESLASTGAARRDHSATALLCHPSAEAVAAFAHQFARLIGPFHGCSPLIGNLGCRLERGTRASRGVPECGGL